MGKIANAVFYGASGAEYDFDAYSLDTEFKNIGAVYIYTKRSVKDKDGEGSHVLLYIGQTNELANRIACDGKWFCVRDFGVNCICVHVDEDKDSRLAKETDLLKANKTPCND
jgi:hypothetical protein